jgi:hypothetical protein
MMEERDRQTGIVYYSNARLGVEQRMFGPYCHFYPEGDEIRVVSILFSTEGWQVGYGDIITTHHDEYNIGDEALVVWDTTNYVTACKRETVRPLYGNKGSIE